MKTILKYLKPYYLKMLLGFVIKVSGTVSELALPYILSHILENVVRHMRVDSIIYWGVLMIIFALLACFLNIIANRMAAKVSRDFSETLRHDLFRKTLRISARQTDNFTIASLESRITTDTYNIHHFIGMLQRMGVRAPILMIGGIIITLFMDSFLALTMLATLPVTIAVIYFISKKGIPLYTKVQKSVDNMIRVVREDSQGIRVIKALSKDEYEHRRYDTVNRKLVQDEQHAGIVMSSVNPIMTLLMNIGLTFAVAISASRVANHTSTPETVIAFIQYFTQISMALVFITRMFVMVSKSVASAKRIEEVLIAEDELPVKNADCRKTPNFIEFNNVSFSYNGKKPICKNIDFKLKKGDSLGIIGATGSGKSTLIKLLLRFYDVSSGSILINGQDIRSIDKEKLYSMFGTAMQNDFLYADTIYENIRFGRNLTREEILSASKIAQAHDFIEDFSEGYNHELSQKGTNISGGQKQRILIARALAAKPDILILDDSSSALDYKTEAALRKALYENMLDTTVITVAQRVSAVKDCSLILVLDKGEIIGRGTHNELLACCPEYKEISDSQMGGALFE